MQYDFLKQFPKRMEYVGRFVLLIQNASQKAIWKNYGFNKIDEQINIIFAVMLYIMEQSLKDEVCTADDIGAYIDNINMIYFQKNMGYDESKELANFIINVVFSNEGKPMYFDGFDFEAKTYYMKNISYIGNRIIYTNSDIKRTSYYLTDDGYNLILSTLEIENNMKITIHEMIFKMQFEKQSYDKAVDAIKNVFQLLHIQLQKIGEAISKIRRNALSYTIAQYESILKENLDTISNTKEKFQYYRDSVNLRIKKLEEMNINVKRLDEREEENLRNLNIIEDYLNRTIDEYQKILGSHFDLKLLYTHELEQLSQVSSIKRFSLQNDFYDLLIKNPNSLENIDIFFRPLFYNNPSKIYNLNKATQLQKPISKKNIEEEDEILDFGNDDWQREQVELQKIKLKKYRKSITWLLDKTLAKGGISLEEIAIDIENSLEDRNILIPSVEIFKEIIIELIKNREIDFLSLKKEKSQFITDTSNSFYINEMLLNIIESSGYEKISKLIIYKKDDGKVVIFNNVLDDYGNKKTIRCSNIQITAIEGD